MLADGLIEGTRVGHQWVIEAHAVQTAAARKRPSHRPWSPSSAWAVLALADGTEPRCKPYERHRAVQRLKRGLPNIVDCLASRSRKHCFYAHPEQRQMIETQAGVVRTGFDAAADYKIGLVGFGPFHAYVSETKLYELCERFVLLKESRRANLWLNVVLDDVWPFPDEVSVAPPTVVAVDLLESSDERCRAAGTELLSRL